MIGFGRVLKISFFFTIARTVYSVRTLVLFSMPTVVSSMVVLLSGCWWLSFNKIVSSIDSSWSSFCVLSTVYTFFSNTAKGLSNVDSLPVRT